MYHVVHACLAALMFFAGTQIEHSWAAEQAVVTVGVKVESFAEFTIPNNGNFKIIVEPQRQCPAMPASTPKILKLIWAIYCWDYFGLREWPLIKPVRIPFSVTGNTTVSMSMAPHRFLRIRGGRYMGEAKRTSGGQTIGYHGIVHFPVPLASYAWILDWLEWDDWRIWGSWAGYGRLPIWSRIAHLPGLNNLGTPPLLAQLPSLNNKAFGVIYIVARRDWTSSGQNATPGDYLGTVVITVAPN